MRVRFDQQVDASNKSLEHIMWTDLIQAPEVGELVSLRGYPYIVIERGWVMPDDDEDGDLYTQYAHVTVLPATASMGTPVEIRQDEERDREDAEEEPDDKYARGWRASDQAEDAGKAYMEENYPDWESPGAYWD